MYKAHPNHKSAEVKKPPMTLMEGSLMSEFREGAVSFKLIQVRPGGGLPVGQTPRVQLNV